MRTMMTVEFKGKDGIELLLDALEKELGFRIPEYANVFIKVPGHDDATLCLNECLVEIMYDVGD